MNEILQQIHLDALISASVSRRDFAVGRGAPITNTPRKIGNRKTMKMLQKLAIAAAILLLGVEAQAMRWYSPSTGRWLSRDPSGTSEKNLYLFVCNNSLSAYDFLGLWGTDVHFHKTRNWGRDLGMPLLGALTIGDYDDQVDSDFSPYTFSDANWKWHFNRSLAGNDSRLEMSDAELQEAKKACTNPTDDWLAAAKHMGRSLHPLQDWVAHGDFNRRSEAPYISSVGVFEQLDYAHNALTKQAGMGWASVDDAGLDSDGADGRASFDVLRFAKITSVGDRLYWANFHPGSQRIKLTETKTKGKLSEFMEHVRSKGKPCGECQQHFLKQN